MENYNEYLKKHILKTTSENMSEVEKEEYIKLYTLYRRLFGKYIIEKLGLKEYDEQIKNSQLGIAPTKIEDMDMYQYFSSDDLCYFYIRNDMHIERLDIVEKEYLRRKVSEKNYDLDEQSKEFIEKTYQKVIVNEEFNEFENTISFYGVNSMSYAAPSHALVIGARYDEFIENDLSDEEWSNLNRQQFMFLQPMYDRMEVLLEDKINMPVSVIKYNEYSVDKMFDKKSSKDVSDFEEI